MAKIYVASSWRNQAQQDIVCALRAAGHKVYDFRDPEYAAGFQWSDLDKDWETWTPEEYRQQLLASPRAAQGFMNDFRAMMWADTCVLVQPCGRSAHLEFGWFVGQGKTAIMLLADGEPELMALMADTLVTSTEELIERLAD